MEMLSSRGILTSVRDWAAELLLRTRGTALGHSVSQFSESLVRDCGSAAPCKPIAIVGLQRSGTNYLEAVLLGMYGAERLMNPFWKHAFPGEFPAEHLDQTTVVLLARHPVLWLNSCLEHYPADLMDKRYALFEGVGREAGYAALYNKFYGEWLAAVGARGGVWGRYEDMLRGDFRGLETLGGRPAAGLTPPARVPQSLQFADEDRARSLRMECTIPEATAKAFWDALDPDLLMRIGYRFEEARFTDRLGVRTIAYRLLHRPQDVDEAEFGRLVEAAGSRFGDDAAVLHAIGKRLARRGRAAEALDWHVVALAACDREDAAFGHKSRGRLLRFDILEEVLALFRRGEIDAAGAGGRDLAWFERAFQSSAAQAEQTLRETQEIGEANGDAAVVRATNLFQLSDRHRRAGRIDEAVAAARGALELWPDNAGFHHHLAALLISQGEFTVAEAALRRAIELEPASAPHHYVLAEMFASQGRVEDALEQYACATRGEGVHPWYHHQRGQMLAKTGRLDEAAASLGEAIRAEPDNALHHFVLNEIRQRQDRLGEAEASLRAALRCTPDDGRLHFALSVLLQRVGRLADALPHLEAATASRQSEPWFFHCRGVLQERLDRLEQAEASFREAVWREPDNMIHHYVLFELLRRQARLGEAKASLDEALRCAPGNGKLLFLLGEVLRDMGRPEEGLAHMEAAGVSAEADAWILHWLGVHLAGVGRFDEAEANLSEAIRREPDGMIHHYALYEARRARGRLADAQASLREALRCASDDPRVRAALEQLSAETPQPAAE